MNILFLADNFPPERNAQASRVYERACWWARWGHEVTVLTCCPNFPEGRPYAGYRNRWRHVETVDGIRVVRVKTYMAPNAGAARRAVDFFSFLPSSLIAGLLERRPDVVAATSPQPFAAVAGALLAALKRAPFLLELSDLWPDSVVAVGAMKRSPAIRLLEKLELWLYRRARRIMPVTTAFKRNLVRRGVPEHKIDVVINGVDLGRYAPRPRDPELAEAWGIRPGDFVAGYLGTHGMAHALFNVLDAAEWVTDPRIRFLFVGAGAERDALICEARQRGLANVTFAPAQPKEAMPRAWSLCDVALVHLRNTPLFETVIPSKIFEAMGMGLPILLAAPQGEASAIVEAENAGLAVPAEDPVVLAAALELLARNAALTSTYARNSRNAAPRYSRETQARASLIALARAVDPNWDTGSADRRAPDSVTSHAS